MFQNLETEQVRNGFSDEYVAEKLGISPPAYRSRKESGTFLVPEVVALLAMYERKFEYLFRMETL
jgi:hypothetical protein